MTLGELIARASERYGEEFVRVLPRCRFWINGEEPASGLETPLGPGDEVAVLPPVSGG